MPSVTGTYSGSLSSRIENRHLQQTSPSSTRGGMARMSTFMFGLYICVVTIMDFGHVEWQFFSRMSVDQWEAMGRPDILEKNCHSRCPKSMIVTTKMYHPNMKVDILAIPPRKDPDDVCCKWRFSMRDEHDPEYVPVELTTKPGR